MHSVALTAARISGVVFGLSSIGLVAITMNLGNVLDASNLVNGAVGGPLLGLFTVGMFVPHVNTTGALWGLLVSVGVSFWLNITHFLYQPESPALPKSVIDCMEIYNATNHTIPP